MGKRKPKRTSRPKSKSPIEHEKDPREDFAEIGGSPVPGLTLRHVLRGHKDWIGRIAWSPDGSYLASPSGDDTVRIWDSATGSCIRTLGENDDVISLAWSPDGQRLASYSWSTLSVWDTQNGNLIRALKAGYGFDIAWSPDGQMIAIPENQTLAIYRLETGEIVKHIRVLGSINSVAWSAKNGMLIIADNGGDLSLFSKELEPIDRLKADRESYCIALSPDGTMLASAGFSSKICLWELATLRRIANLEAHIRHVVSLSFSSDGLFLASKSDDHSVRLWRCPTFELVGEIQEQSKGGPRPFRGLEFNPKVLKLATLGEQDTIVRIWELDEAVLIAQAQENVNYTTAKLSSSVIQA